METDLQGARGLHEQGRSGAGQTDRRLRERHAGDEEDGSRPAEAGAPGPSDRAHAGAGPADARSTTQGPELER